MCVCWPIEPYLASGQRMTYTCLYSLAILPTGAWEPLEILLWSQLDCLLGSMLYTLLERLLVRLIQSMLQKAIQQEQYSFPLEAFGQWYTLSLCNLWLTEGSKSVEALILARGSKPTFLSVLDTMIMTTDTITITNITITNITITNITITNITIIFVTIAFITITLITIGISPGLKTNKSGQNWWEVGSKLHWKISFGDLLSPRGNCLTFLQNQRLLELTI